MAFTMNPMTGQMRPGSRPPMGQGTAANQLGRQRLAPGGRMGSFDQYGQGGPMYPPSNPQNQPNFNAPTNQTQTQGGLLQGSAGLGQGSTSLQSPLAAPTAPGQMQQLAGGTSDTRGNIFGEGGWDANTAALLEEVGRLLGSTASDPTQAIADRSQQIQTRAESDLNRLAAQMGAFGGGASGYGVAAAGDLNANAARQLQADSNMLTQQAQGQRMAELQQASQILALLENTRQQGVRDANDMQLGLESLKDTTPPPKSVIEQGADALGLGWAYDGANDLVGQFVDQLGDGPDNLMNLYNAWSSDPEGAADRTAQNGSTLFNYILNRG